MIFNENGEILNENIFSIEQKQVTRQINVLLLDKMASSNFDEIIIFADLSKKHVDIEGYCKYKNKKLPLFDMNVITKLSALLKEEQDNIARVNRNNSRWQYCVVHLHKSKELTIHYDYNDDNISFDEFKRKNNIKDW